MSKGQIQLARREMTMMELMDHKNIIKLNSSFEDDTFLILIMDKMFDDLRNIVMDFSSPMEEDFARNVFR